MQKNNHQKGFAALFLSVLVTAVALAIAGSISLVTFSNISISRNLARSAQAEASAEAGIEDAAYRIKNLLPYSSNYVLEAGSVESEVAVVAEGNTRIVVSKGQQQSSFRNFEAVLTVSTSGVSFFYGIQVGSLGLTMGNGSVVAGNVFSNGNIKGSGSGSSTITGTAKAAGQSTIEDIEIDGDAYANRLEDCVVSATAFYFTEIEDCETGSVQILDQQVQPESFPITQEQIDVWKAAAEAGGTQGGASFGNGAQVALGPKKINGSLSFGNTSTLTLGGTLWVTGAMSLGNTAIIKLASGYGNSSGVIIVDGPVSFGNGVVIQGSGEASSKLMFVSLYTGTAFSLGNTGQGDIFYAPNGTIAIGNGFAAEELTGKGLSVGNNTTVTYEAGLANTNFSSGPGATFEVQSWKEIE